MTSRAAGAPLLMTPGPTRVPDRVLDAGARPMIHHRSPEFSRELATAIELLGPLFGTRGAPMPVHTTGRGALEATIVHGHPPICAVPWVNRHQLAASGWRTPSCSL